MLRLLRFLALLVPAFALAVVTGGSAPAFAVALLAVTWICLRLDGEGLPFRWKRLGLGFAAGVLLFSLITVVRAAAVGASWEFRPSPAAVFGGLAFMLCSVLFEELLFRGYLLHRLSALGGPVLAVLVTSALFGAYHVVGRPYWGIGAVFAFAMPALGGVLFAYAQLSSRGLALPIGLHWGGNWATVSLFGWGGGGALWTTEVSPAQAHALTAPDLLPHLPYLAALGVLALVVRYGRFHRDAH